MLSTAQLSFLRASLERMAADTRCRALDESSLVTLRDTFPQLAEYASRALLAHYGAPDAPTQRLVDDPPFVPTSATAHIDDRAESEAEALERMADYTGRPVPMPLHLQLARSIAQAQARAESAGLSFAVGRAKKHRYPRQAAIARHIAMADASTAGGDVLQADNARFERNKYRLPSTHRDRLKRLAARARRSLIASGATRQSALQAERMILASYDKYSA